MQHAMYRAYLVNLATDRNKLVSLSNSQELSYSIEHTRQLRLTEALVAVAWQDLGRQALFIIMCNGVLL
jgi:hypothetical protein